MSSLGQDAVRSFEDAAALAVKEYLTGDADEHQENIRALGGHMPEGENLEHWLSFWRVQAAQFAMRPVDVEHVLVVPYAIAGVQHSTTESRRALYDEGYIGAGTLTANGRFPEVESYANRKLDVYEVRIPMLARSSKSPNERAVIIGVALAWDPEARRWQPVQYLLYRSGPNDHGLIPQIHY